MEKGLYDLEIDPQIESFMPKLTDEAEAELEKSLLANGCYNPIHTNNGTIIDGHNRYRICKKYNIPFAVEEHHFNDIYEVMRWMLSEPETIWQQNSDGLSGAGRRNSRRKILESTWKR